LASTGTEEEFRQDQIIYFAQIWRNIILTSFAFIVGVFLLLDGFITSTANSLNERLANFTNLPETEEVSKLQEEASKFNSKVSLAIQAKQQSLRWSGFLEEIKNVVGGNITIDRIYIQSPSSGTVLFNGRASNESAIVNFKEALEKNGYFKDINLPLASIKPLAGGMLGFSVDFKADNSLINPL
jgi:Tfp pilus assembly protein PilN